MVRTIATSSTIRKKLSIILIYLPPLLKIVLYFRLRVNDEVRTPSMVFRWGPYTLTAHIFNPVRRTVRYTKYNPMVSGIPAHKQDKRKSPNIRQIRRRKKINRHSKHEIWCRLPLVILCQLQPCRGYEQFCNCLKGRNWIYLMDVRCVHFIIHAKTNR